MARTGRYIFILIMCCFSPSILMAGILTGSLNKTSGSLEELFEYTLQISGSIQSEPEFPSVNGLEVAGRSQSSSIQIINGRTSRQVTLVYSLRALKEGVFDIPSIEVKLDGQIEKTFPLQITVKPLTLKQRRARPLYAEQEVSIKDLYEGQSSILTVRLYSSYKLEGDPGIIIPSSPGLRLKALGEPISNVREISGRNYQVVEARYLLVADKASIEEVPPFVFRVALSTGRRGFFSLGPEVRDVRSNGIQLTVKGLPLSGRQASFSGLVGEFTGNVEVSNRDVKVGDNLPIYIQIVGDGETSSMASPSLRLKDALFKMYKDKPTDNINLIDNSKIRSERVLNFALVPQQAGEFSLGSISTQYFSPMENQYKNLVLDLGTVSVTGALTKVTGRAINSVKNTNESWSNENVEILGEDIVGLRSSSELNDSDDLHRSGWLLGLGISFCSFLLYSFSVLKTKSDSFFRNSESKSRNVKAYKNYKKVVKSLETEEDPVHRVCKLQKAFSSYLGDKLNANSGSLTENDIASILSNQKISSELIDKSIKLFEKMNSIRYSANSGMNDVGAVADEALSLIKKLEKQC